MQNHSLRKFFPVVLIGLAIATTIGCASPPKVSGTPADWRKSMQPTLAESDREQLARELTLAHAIPLAATRNPAVQAEKLRWLASIEVEPQATSLPDPTIQFGYQFNSVETRVGPQRWNTGVNQQLPWFQKLQAKGTLADIQAAAAQLRYEAALRDLIVRVKDAYYELYYLDNAVKITQTVENLLNNEALLAYQELTVGRTQLNEAFRAESWAAQLKYDRLLLSEQRTVQAERIKTLLNLPPETDIGQVTACPLYDVSGDVEPLYNRAETYSELLKIKGLETVKSSYNLYLAKLSRIPDISLGLNLIETGPARMAGVSGSGRNPFIGLFSMNLPIWEQRTQALIHEKKAQDEAAQRQAMNEVNQVRAAVAKAYFSVRLTERLAALYADTLLPQAESVMHQAELLFRADRASFSNILESTLAWHNFQLAYRRALADRGQAIGRLERALGTTAQAAGEGE